MSEKIHSLLDFINSNAIIRRLVLFAAIVMTWRVSVWGILLGTEWLHMAPGIRPAGIDMAAVIGAVTAPLTLFTGAVFRAYVEGKAQ